VIIDYPHAKDAILKVTWATLLKGSISFSWNFLFGVIFCFLLSCSSPEKRQVEEDTYTEPQINIIVQSPYDTIENGKIYTAKVYLNNDSLYSLAMKNNIENYLMVKYEPTVDTTKFSLASHATKLVGDTAYISFAVHDDPSHFNNFGLNSRIWQVDFNINYLNDSYNPDTTFIQLFKFFVRNRPVEKY
jgi:hypothetical protein